MGYHVVVPGDPGHPHDVPVIRKDGGTGSWRDAKKYLRNWYLEEAGKLREVKEKTYFNE